MQFSSIKILLLILLVFIKCSHQRIQDPSFHNYCKRLRAEIEQQSIETDEHGKEVKNPVGDKCKVSLNVYARDKNEARLYCERWGIFVLIDWDVDGYRVSCTYENVYECENNYQQIRGMCYQQFYELKTYEEAEIQCKQSHSKAEILKIQSKHHGDLLEANFIGDLTMFFVQPDKNLESSSQFVDPDSTSFSDSITKSTSNETEEDQDKNYVILYNYGIHYDVGPNTIIKLDKTIKAFAMCMYQPPETILSFGVKAKKLAELYHPTQLVGAMAVWRTASHYTPTNIPGYPNSHEDTCEKSMKAILGTSDGTLLNLKPATTKLLSTAVKKSFNRAFGPFSYCEYNDHDGNVIYFASKEVRGRSCQNQANILEKDYNAKWKRNKKPYNYSFVYYPEKTDNDKTFEAFPRALHSPMLCGLHYDKDVHKSNPVCPRDAAFTFKRSSGTVCHYNDHTPRTFAKSQEYCRERGMTLSRWESYGEFYTLEKHWCDGGWAACVNENACQAVEADSYGRHGVVSLTGVNLQRRYPDDLHHVFCEMYIEDI